MILTLQIPYIKAFLKTLHRGLYRYVKSESSQKIQDKDEIELMNKHFNGKSYVKDGIESDFWLDFNVGFWYCMYNFNKDMELWQKQNLKNHIM